MIERKRSLSSSSTGKLANTGSSSIISPLISPKKLVLSPMVSGIIFSEENLDPNKRNSGETERGMKEKDEFVALITQLKAKLHLQESTIDSLESDAYQNKATQEMLLEELHTLRYCLGVVELQLQEKETALVSAKMDQVSSNLS